MISLLTIVGALAVMFTIEWRLALVVCVDPADSAYRRHPAPPENEQRSRASVKKRTAAINAEIESSLSGIRTAKAFANEAVEFGKFERGQRPLQGLQAGVPPARWAFSPARWSSSSRILSVAVITVGGALIMQGRMDLVDLLTFSLYISTFISPVRKLVNFRRDVRQRLCGPRAASSS